MHIVAQLKVQTEVDMKHILHVIQSLEFGGAEKVVVQLANKFCDEYKVTVCVTKKMGELAKELSPDVKIVAMNMGEGNNPALISKLKELIVEQEVDIVHCHDWGVYVESALSVKKAGRAKVILTAHGPYTQYAPGLISKLKKMIRHIVERYLSKFTYKIVAVSDSIKSYIKKEIGIGDDKVSVIHNGVQGYNYEFTTHSDKCRKLITVGRVAKIKNHRLMIDAISTVIKSIKDVRLTIVGDGPEFENIKKYTNEIGLSDVVTFTGFRTDIEELLKLHDAFLLSSHYEGISIAGLEAMSLGLPIVSTNVGGVSEMVQDGVNGLLAENNSVTDYAQCLAKLCSDDDLFEELSRSSRAVFCDKFQEDAMLNDYRSLYEA